MRSTEWDSSLNSCRSDKMTALCSLLAHPPSPYIESLPPIFYYVHVVQNNEKNT